MPSGDQPSPGGLERAAVAGQGAGRGQGVRAAEGEAAVVAADRDRPARRVTTRVRPPRLVGAVAVLGLGGAGQAVPDPQRGRRPQPAAHDRHDAHAVRGHRGLVEVPDALGGFAHQPIPKGAASATTTPRSRRRSLHRVGRAGRLQPGEQIRVPRAVRAGGNRDRRVVHQAAHRLRQVVRRPAPTRRPTSTGTVARPECSAVSTSTRTGSRTFIRRRRPEPSGWWSSRGRSRRTLRRTGRPPVRPRRAATTPNRTAGGPMTTARLAVPAAQAVTTRRRLGRRVGPPVAEVDPRPPAEQAAAEQCQQHQAGEQGRDEPAQADRVRRRTAPRGARRRASTPRGARVRDARRHLSPLQVSRCR